MSDTVMTPVAGVDMAPSPVAEAPTNEVDPFLAFEPKDEFSEDADDTPAGEPPSDDALEDLAEAVEAKKYEVESADGTKKKMSVAEMQKALKASGMFQADHTRKTQELAEGRKELSRMAAATKAESTKAQQMMDGIREYFGAIASPEADPYYVMRMLEREGVPIRRAVTKVVEDVLREQNLPEQDRATREMERRKRAALAEEKYHEDRVAKAKAAADEHARSTKQAAATRLMKDWGQRAMKEVSLPNQPYAQDRLLAELRSIASKERRMLQYEDFVDAAKAAKKALVSPLVSMPEEDVLDGLDEAAQRKFALALQARLKKAPAQPAAPASGSRPGAPVTRDKNTGKYKRPTLAERIRNGG